MTVRLAPTSTGTQIGVLMQPDTSPVVAHYTMRLDDELVIVDATAGVVTITLPDASFQPQPTSATPGAALARQRSHLRTSNARLC